MLVGFIGILRIIKIRKIIYFLAKPRVKVEIGGAKQELSKIGGKNLLLHRDFG